MAGLIITAIALSLALTAVAQAQSTKPAVSTGAVANLTAQSVSLLGKIDPSGAQTTYLFQYGTTTLYGSATPVATAGGGGRTVNVIADLTGLASNTTYHYRLVARNRNGTTNGRDRSFKTRRLPLGLSLAATPNPVPFGRPTVLSGALTGTGNVGRQIVLQANPFPYTQGFAQLGNAQVTGADGSFLFPLLSVPLNTQYRVVIPNTTTSSPIVGVGVSVRVSTRVSATRVRTGRRVRFSGTVRPVRAGAQVAIQKQRGARWVTVSGTITRTATNEFSRYTKLVRIRRGGNYRVFVSINDGNFTSNIGRTVRIRRR